MKMQQSFVSIELTATRDESSLRADKEEEVSETEEKCEVSSSKRDKSTELKTDSLKTTNEEADGRCWWMHKQVLEYYKCCDLNNLERCDEYLAGVGEHVVLSSPSCSIAEGQQQQESRDASIAAYHHTCRRMRARFEARMELLIERASMMMQPCVHNNEIVSIEQNEAHISRQMFETWQRASPSMRWFIFSDYVDPRSSNPQLTTFDVVMRVLALHPFVSCIPKHLQKLSVARALFSEFIHFDRSQASVWTNDEEGGSKKKTKLIYAKMQSLIDNWKLVERGMRAAAAVITSFVGLETFGRKGVHTLGSSIKWCLLYEDENSTGKWKGFDCVFGKLEFAHAFIALRDPYTVLPPIITRVENDIDGKSEVQGSDSPSKSLSRRWGDLKVKASAAHPQLLQRVCHRLRPENTRTVDDRHERDENIIFGHERLFALLWRCYVRLKGNVDKVHGLLEDWFDCGIEKRLKKINDRIERAGGYGIVNVKRIRATESLVILYLSGLHHYMPEMLNELFESSENPIETTTNSSSVINPPITSNLLDTEGKSLGYFQKEELDKRFLDQLFASRIILDRPHLYRWDFHLDPAAITWAYHQMEP